MKNKIIFFIIFINYQLFSSGLGDVLIELKAKDENRVVIKDNIEITYYTKEKKKIVRKKIFKDKKLVTDTYYDYDTGYKKHQTVFTYDKTSKKIKTIIKRSYHENGKLYQEYKRGSKYKIYNKKFHEDGTISDFTIYDGKTNKVKESISYDKKGVVTFKRVFKKNSTVVQWFKNGKLIKEKNYLPNEREDTLNGATTLYDLNGTIISETLYDYGKYLYTSECSFSTIDYMKKLDLKYHELNPIVHGDIKCRKLDKRTSVIVTNYVSKGVKTVLAVIDTDKKVIKQSKLNKKPNVQSNSEYHLGNYSYASMLDKNIFDTINTVYLNQDETETFYDTYKITDNKIMLLKQPTFKLKDIEKQAKNGKKFKEDELHAMMSEITLSDKTVTSYNNIAYYLQKNGFHKEAIRLLQSIIYTFPNRTVAYLNIADSFMALQNKKDALANYKKYVELIKKQGKENKIPQKVKKYIADNTPVCLSPKNIKVQIEHIDDDKDKIIFKNKDNKTIKEVEFLRFINVPKRYFYKDLNFDGVDELLVNISSHEQRLEYKLYTIKCKKIVPFNLKTIHSFKLNYENKTLTEYSKGKNNKAIINTYCSDARDGNYYLCNREEP